MTKKKMILRKNYQETLQGTQVELLHNIYVVTQTLSGEIIPRVWTRVRVRVGLRVEDRVRLRVRGRVGF